MYNIELLEKLTLLLALLEGYLESRLPRPLSQLRGKHFSQTIAHDKGSKIPCIIIECRMQVSHNSAGKDQQVLYDAIRIEEDNSKEEKLIEDARLQWILPIFQSTDIIEKLFRGVKNPLHPILLNTKLIPRKFHRFLKPFKSILYISRAVAFPRCELEVIKPQRIVALFGLKDMAPHIWSLSLRPFVVDLIVDILNRKSNGYCIFSEIWNNACFFLLNDLYLNI